MNIIIPLAGKGERFLNHYIEPKPMIKIFDKMMLEYVIDNLNIKNNKVFIFYRQDLDNYSFSTLFKQKYDYIYFIPIPETRGAAETILLGINMLKKLNIIYHAKTLIVDCDTFYTENIINLVKNENLIFYRKKQSEKPIYSYIQLDENNNVIEIIEKEKISDNANTGAYFFNNINNFIKYGNEVINKNITFKNEYYISCVINEMLKYENFKGYELNDNQVFSLGTPEEVTKYIDNTYAFLFDLDGTLVNTDDIYFKVWYNYLLDFNIVLTFDMYKMYIQGNSDDYVINNVFYLNINVNEFSNIKDDLFIQYCHNIHVIDGVYDIIEQIKDRGYKYCIVTNSNRKVCDWIIKTININPDFSISKNDCIHGKPNPEPYIKAINKYNISKNKCLIFEDSKTGILSGLNVYPKTIIGIESIYDSNTLLNLGVNMAIKNYKNININDLLKIENNTLNDIKNSIIKSFNLHDNFEINLNESNLKGGFIASVISFEFYSKNNINHYVLKYETKTSNNLSNMAYKLELYKREYYFYKNIANYLKFIKIPKYINTIYDDELNENGIILENLYSYNMEKDINLNENNIDISLKIIDRMAKMHSFFWNKNLKRLFPLLYNSTDSIFNPFFQNFINERYNLFMNKWQHMMNDNQIKIINYIFNHFESIQKQISLTNTTFIHGDIKSPNIFYDLDNQYEPYFLDWQHCAIGKGTQDLIFFIIESFDIQHIKLFYPIFKNYYYQKLTEYKINYSYNDYNEDIKIATYYIPFFTAIWFGSVPNDELIDKNWPFFFIKKYLFFIEYIDN